MEVYHGTSLKKAKEVLKKGFTANKRIYVFSTYDNATSHVEANYLNEEVPGAIVIIKLPRSTILLPDPEYASSEGLLGGVPINVNELGEYEGPAFYIEGPIPKANIVGIEEIYYN